MSRRALVGCLMVLGVLLLALPSGALATPSSTPLDGYVTNGTVNAVAQSGGTLYLGGSFSQVGPRTGAFVGVSSGSGLTSTPYPQVNGSVDAMVADGSGGYYIGGQFTAVHGTAINNAAHIRADGTLDTAWNPNPDAAVNALAVSGSTVYLGGHFTQVTNSSGSGTVTRIFAAAVDATTGRDTGWNPNPNAQVYALAVSGSTVYLGGDFSQVTSSDGIGTATRNHAAAVDASTGYDTGWNPNPNSTVEALAVSGSNVYLGGYFTQVTNSSGSGTVTRNYAAAVDATTGHDSGWNPNPNSVVDALAVSGSTVYLGGYFSQVTNSSGSGTATRNYAAAVDASTGYDTGWHPSPNAVVLGLAVSGSTVYLGGNFSQVTNSNGTGTVSRNYTAAVDATSGQDTGWNPNPNNEVNALAVSGSTVYLGGFFNSVHGVARSNAAALDSTGTVTGWNPDPDSDVEALAVSGSTVYLGGRFSQVTDSTGAGTVTRNSAAAVDATTGRDTGWNPNPNSDVYALAVSGSTVYLGGDFSQITDSTGSSSVTRNHAAAVDATTGRDTGWNPNPNNDVEALAMSGSTVYLGGKFTQVTDSTGAGTVTRDYAAAVDATTGDDTGWNPNPNAVVNALAVSGSTAYLGGQFTQVTDSTGTTTVTRDYAAAVDATTGQDTGWNPNPDNTVDALAVSGSTVYLGGQFTQVTNSTGTGSATRNHAAAVDATTGQDTGWNPNPDNTVNALAVSGSTAYLGGNFDSVGLLPQSYIAEFQTPPNPPTALGTIPASPGQSTTPTVTGTAEAGSTVNVYTTADCSGTPVATGTAGDFGSTGLPVTAVAAGSTTSYYATATDQAGYTSACSTDHASYTQDSTAPAAPTSLATTPASPGQSTTPKVTGTAETGSTVNVYTTADCSGTPVATGTAADFSSPGLTVTAVTSGSTTSYYATATDQAGNASTCSTDHASYTQDSTAPAAPTALGTTPASPGQTTTPKVTGTAEIGSTVNVYTTADCSGTAVATGTAADFSSTGLTVTAVAAGSTTTYYATATDQAENTSACSTDHASYTQDSTAPAAPTTLGTTPASPGQSTTPKVTGTAETGSTVNVYTTADCSGTPVATGTAADFSSPGLTVTAVATGSTTTYYATATDPALNTSACSTDHASYTQDSTAPAAPTALGTTPASPGQTTTPKVTGTAETGSTVNVYTTADCSGTPVATGTAADFGSTGLSVTAVAAGSTTTYYATATDQAENTSACSTDHASYTQDSTAPTPPTAPTALGTTPASPGQTTTPKVTGTAEAGSTVNVYTTADCSGIAVATGTAADFGSTGLTVTAVSAGSTTTYYATATDAGNTSACSTDHASYTQQSSSPPPADRTPPNVIVSSPTAPAGQDGYFNAANLKAAGGKITVRVAASDSSGVTSLVCADNGRAIALSAQTGSNPRTAALTLSANGTHQLACVASDGATPANTGAAPGSHPTATVNIDTTIPTATISGLARYQRQHAITVKWAGRDTGSGIAGYDFRERQVKINSTRYGRYTTIRPVDTKTTAQIPGTPGNTACFSTRTRDKAGNLSAYTAEQCTTNPLNQSALTRHGKWKQVSRPGYYAGSILRTTTPHATLTSPTITGRQIALLATTQPHGGTIQITWHHHTHTISLKTRHTQLNHILILRGITGTGRLKITVTRAGTTEIGGLAAYKHP